MKKLLIVLLVFFNVSWSQDAEMNTKLTQIVADFDSIQNIGTWKKRFAAIEQLKNGNDSLWLANYYSVYCCIQMSYSGDSKETKDLYLDLAEMYMKMVEKSCPMQDEVWALRAYIANARLSVDGMNRWKQYGPIFDGCIAKGKEINPNNPHLSYLKGVSIFFQPKFVGGGPEAALPFFLEAQKGFEAMTSFSADKPFWGRFSLDYYISEGNKAKK